MSAAQAGNAHRDQIIWDNGASMYSPVQLVEGEEYMTAECCVGVLQAVLTVSSVGWDRRLCEQEVNKNIWLRKVITRAQRDRAYGAVLDAGT